MCLIYSSSCITLRHMSLKFFCCYQKSFCLCRLLCFLFGCCGNLCFLFNDTCAHIWQLIRIHLQCVSVNGCVSGCVCMSVLGFVLKAVVAEKPSQNVISCQAHPQHFRIKSIYVYMYIQIASSLW